MKPLLLLFLVLISNLALQQGCNGPGNDPGGSRCSTPFYPPYNVRTRLDPYRGGVVVEWNDRGYKDGYQVFRCIFHCTRTGQDGRLYANLQNFEAITNNKFAGTSLLDKNVLPGVTYHYAVQNRYQSCGVNWSDNFATIPVP